MLFLTSSAIVAVLAGLAQARNPINGIDHYFGPEQPISNQCAPECKSGDVACHGKKPHHPRVCPVQLGDFHYLCGEYDYLEAAEACAKKGWRLAVLNEENRRDGYDNMAQCLLIGGEAAWISNYLGQDADPCAVLLRSGGVLLGLGQQACSKRRLGALCQDIPVKTLTTSTTISTVTYSGVSTVTETVTKCKPKPPCHNCHKPDCYECDRHHYDKNLEAEDDADRCPHGNCAPVCPFKLGDIRIIQKNVTPFDAAKECEKYGWTLLDLTVGRMNDFAEVAKHCSFGEENLWINSFNGVASPCLNSFGAKYSNVVPVGYPVIDEWCALDNLFYVACQRSCQFPTGNGPYSGLIGKTVTTQTSSVVFTLPSATVTVTKTCWRKDSSSSDSSSSSDCSSDSSSSDCSSDSSDDHCCGRRRHH